MILLVLTSSVFAFSLFCIIFGIFGMRSDHKSKRLGYIQNNRMNEIYEELELSFYKRFIYPKLVLMSKAIAKISPKNKNKAGANAQLEKQLRHAGIMMTPSEYQTINLFVIFAITVIFSIMAFFIKRDFSIKLLIMLLGGVCAVILPKYFLITKIKTRQQNMQVQLPEVMDVLSVSIEAGLSFDAALIKIAEKMKGELIDELLILYREIQMGRPRRDAFKNLGECSDIPELKNFASALSQAEQLGIPVKNILKIQSSQLRVSRRQRAQEKGMKAPIKIMIPMVMFIFPVIFIILLGPTVIKLIAQFG